MKLETERLELVPLTLKQLKLWEENISALETELKCSYKAEKMEGFFLGIVKGQIVCTEKDEENYLYHTFWFIMRKSDRMIVGSADFKDVPDKNGEVEIGYGLGEQFEHNGYMTETVKAMCDWAMKQKAIKHVIAETDIAGFASQRILQRCGFIQYKQGETLWWKLS